MKKPKSKKSLFASQAPPPRVKIKGSTQKISMADMRLEYNGMLAMFAAVMEANEGKVFIDTETLQKVTKQGRVIQIIPGTLGYTFQFESTPQETEPVEPTVEVAEQEKDFFNSDTAKEAREFLAQQRKEKDGTTN